VPIRADGPSDLWITISVPGRGRSGRRRAYHPFSKTLPTIFSALSSGFQAHAQRHGRSGRQASRTEDDFLHGTALIGSALLVVLMFFFPLLQAGAGASSDPLRIWPASLLIVFFGFLFVHRQPRASWPDRLLGQPVSGMTIATTDGHLGHLSGRGLDRSGLRALAITIGGVVCIASCEAGDTSQDLKTGFLVGATPPQAEVGLPHRHSGLNLRRRRYSHSDEHRAAGVSMRRRSPGIYPFRTPASRCSHNPAGLNDRIPVMARTRRSSMHPKSEYIVLNALGSSELADGKYLYSPTSKQNRSAMDSRHRRPRRLRPPGPLMATSSSGI